MKLKVIQSYQEQYLNPIILNVGDKVVLGNEETEENWKGWVWAEIKNNSGWIPMQIVEFSFDRKSGIIKKDYSAQELTVIVNDIVILIESLNGWLWVKSCQTNKEGWFPSECVDLSN
ncbi:SH3 domain-containing protein [Flavobacterium amniphilum]|uniref:SH3 domain-containing protein n=1 Tax=Flavobacterium amniphilum TaxID=1834035 RepID=UPI00202A8653|nr:SH3 domain-containing protein [Flavobacterium amniphilum]MCL9804135.1 SH3 domain-containing protein [Flavobacterium amniphilum]